MADVEIEQVQDPGMQLIKVDYNEGDIPNGMETPGQLYYNQADDKLYTIGAFNDVLAVGERGSWAAKGGPTSYVSGGVSVWNNVNQSGSMFDTSRTDGITILRTGQYRVVYYQRSASDVTSVYGYVTINGSRSQAEDNLNGIFYHDHASCSSCSVFSSYIGLLNAGDWVSGGANTSGELMYGASDWAGNLTVTRL